LLDLQPGQCGEVAALQVSHPTRLNELSSLGILPGTRLRLKQLRPSVVIQIDETTLALDSDVAGEILLVPNR